MFKCPLFNIVSKSIIKPIGPDDIAPQEHQPKCSFKIFQRVNELSGNIIGIRYNRRQGIVQKIRDYFASWISSFRAYSPSRLGAYSP